MNAALSGWMYADRIGFRRPPNADVRQANFTMPACTKKVYISSNEVKGVSILNEKPRTSEIIEFQYVRSVPERREAPLTLFVNFPPIPESKFPIFSNTGNAD